MSDIEASKKKARGAVAKIIDTLEGLDLEYCEAMAALSATLVLSAINMGVSKEEFMNITELEWDSLAKRTASEETTH